MNELNSFKVGYLYPFWRHPIENTKQFFCNLRFAWQRATRGYSNYDLYDLNDFYTRLFIASLNEFKKDMYSAPSEFYNEEDGSIKEWENYLTKMRDCFYYSLEENYPDNPYGYDMNPEKAVKWDMGINRKRVEKAEEGFDMMKKVFFDLWD